MFDFCKNEKEFYYLICEPSISNSDFILSEILNFGYREYQLILTEKFKATIIGKETYFKNKENVEKAVEWANSILLMNKIGGESKCSQYDGMLN